MQLFQSYVKPGHLSRGPGKRPESGPTIWLVAADPWTRGDDWRRAPATRPERIQTGPGQNGQIGQRQASGRTQQDDETIQLAAQKFPDASPGRPEQGQEYSAHGRTSHRRHPGNIGLGPSYRAGACYEDGYRPRRGERSRRLAASVALLLGLIGFVVSAAGVIIQILPRHFSPAQQRAITSWEISRRWQTMSAGQIFPATVSYQLPATVLEDASPLSLDAQRVSIAPQQTDCAKAVTSAAAGALLQREGCKSVLRATYVDATHSYVMTVGVAVMPNDTAATSANASIDKPQLAASRSGHGSAQLSAGVGVVRFGGAAGKLYDYSRQISESFTDGNYIFMYAAGYADNRPQVAVGQDPYSRDEMTYLAEGVAQSVQGQLAAKPAAPHCPGTPGC